MACDQHLHPSIRKPTLEERWGSLDIMVIVANLKTKCCRRTFTSYSPYATSVFRFFVTEVGSESNPKPNPLAKICLLSQHLFAASALSSCVETGRKRVSRERYFTTLLNDQRKLVTFKLRANSIKSVVFLQTVKTLCVDLERHPGI